MTYNTTDNSFSDQNGKTENITNQLKIIDEVIHEYDSEILRLTENSKKTFYGMLLSLILSIFIFFVPTMFPKYNNMQASKYPILVQDSINRLLDTQKSY